MAADQHTRLLPPTSPAANATTVRPPYGGMDRLNYLDQRSSRYRWNLLVEVQSQRHGMTLVLLSFHD
ncbi:hypothetical protein [Streptomyces sp. NRRL S-337]|uniref:hypothetical protein n=1 Tax=Streptomyces sp. NRRL S-337 TaxID=1463900 RepID=UPI00131CF829|nr:hypothetical protein [Streptomyces sp. NRRL S-337]